MTERCNSQCRYCYEKSMKEFDNGLDKKFTFDYSAPEKSEIKINELKKFISKDPTPKLIFYGGEPLCNSKKIIEIMDNIDAEFFIQTNGKLLHTFPKQYTNRFSKMLISIDGDKKRTDFNRGKGTYDIVMKNIKQIKDNEFNGEIVARMTISFTDNFTDLTKQIKHLFSIGFDSVHWQLDAGFFKYDYNKETFSKFVDNYNKEISKLINYWIKELKQNNVLKIYPFIGIMQDILNKTKTKLRCGSGYKNYTITTNGTLTCCPIMNCIKDFYVGDINKSDPTNLKQISVSNPCTSCDYKDLCGGRCMYSNYAKLWPRDGEQLVCKTIKHLIDELKEKQEEIENLIEKSVIKLKDFEYEKYFGPEIIP